MKISILSDNHGFLDDQIIGHLKNSDEIWHAGDIGNTAVIDQLENLPGKLRAVYGNIDGKDVRIRASDYLVYSLNGLIILMTHIAGNPPRYNKAVQGFIRRYRPNILVCGHSHILKVQNDHSNKLLFINPGACGHHGFHKKRTIIKFEIQNGRPTNMNVVELGNRGKIKT